MRFITDLQTRASGCYDNTYHHNLRGRVWRALENTSYEQEHGGESPVGFSFSNPFPWGDFEEGEQRHVIFAATREPLLAEVAADLLEETELNIGEMPFKVNDVRPVNPDAGPPGTQGTLRSDTGIVAKVPPQYEAEDDNRDTDTYWQPEHGLGAFKNYIQTQLQRQHERFAPDGVPGPKDVDDPLFTAYDRQKQYALPVEVTTGQEHTFVVNKWEFDYEVRNATHRYHLNLALDAGLGGRTTLGFGFMNIPKQGQSV
jgi:CRISPR-associated endoribonuclease Cas6